MIMNRRQALAAIGGGLVFSGIWRYGMNKRKTETSQRMPVLFLGHGSPMNAIETNEFTRSLNALGKKLPRPRAILCVSAHWMTEGTWVTSMRNPRTIHDFHGFPKSLFDVQYPAPGSPEVAGLIRSTVKDPAIHADDSQWGLDHGTWAVLRQLYPEADIPVLQLSLDIKRAAEFHYELGRRLKALREEGILIVSSGNIVHNLRQIRWEPDAKPFDWAIEFDAWTKDRLMERDHSRLVTDFLSSKAGLLSVPTPDHYYPLLYTLGASDERDELSFAYEGIQNGSISMRAVAFGMRKS